MAVKKAAGGNKAQEGTAAKAKAGVKKGAAKKAAPKAAAKAASTKSAAPKKAAVKKAGAAPVKLSTSQSDLLKKVHGAAEPGYRPEKKAEQRTLDALQERKLIKRGAKHKESGSYHYQISNTGKKHLSSQPGETSGATGGSSSGG